MENDFETIQKYMREEEEQKKIIKLEKFMKIFDKFKRIFLFLAMLITIFFIVKFAKASELNQNEKTIANIYRSYSEKSSEEIVFNYENFITNSSLIFQKEPIKVWNEAYRKQAVGFKYTTNPIYYEKIEYLNTALAQNTGIVGTPTEELGYFVVPTADCSKINDCWGSENIQHGNSKYQIDTQADQLPYFYWTDFRYNKTTNKEIYLKPNTEYWIMFHQKERDTGHYEIAQWGNGAGEKRFWYTDPDNDNIFTEINNRWSRLDFYTSYWTTNMGGYLTINNSEIIFNGYNSAYLNFSYDFCEKWDNLTGIYWTIQTYNGTNWGYDYFLRYGTIKENIIGPQQCSGSKNIELLVNDISQFYTNNIRVIASQDPLDLEEEFIAFSNEIPFTINPPNNWGINSENYIQTLFGNFLQITNTTGTTTIQFQYDLTNLNIENSAIYLKNLNGNIAQNAITDEYYKFELATTTESGIGTIDLRNMDASGLEMAFTLSLYRDIDMNTEVLKSNEFVVKFGNEVLNNNDLKLTLMGETCNDIPRISIFGFDTIKDPTSSLFWKCLFNDTIDSISNGFKSIINAFSGFLSNIFPFNFPLMIYNSWNNTENINMPENLKWLEILDENNNVYFTINKEFIAQDENVKWCIWGECAFYINETTENAFKGFKSFSVYLIWVLFLNATIKLGYNVYYILSGQEEIAEQEQKEQTIKEERKEFTPKKYVEPKPKFYKRNI